MTGVHEMVANALIIPGEQKRETDLRMEPLPNVEEEPQPEEDKADEG